MRERRRNLADQSGNVTIIFGLALVAMLGAAGAAIDYARMVQQRTSFTAAADSAVLAAMTAAVAAEKNGKGGIAVLAKQAALDAWNSNLSRDEIAMATSPKIRIKHAGSAWTAHLQFEEDYPTTFMSILGLTSMRVAGSAEASSTIEKAKEYWDFNVAVDDSSSMGIGATQADMDSLIANPAIKCAFACHVADYASGGTDSASIARAAGIKLRIDVVDEAVDSMVSELVAVSQGNNIRAALWGLNVTANPLVPVTAKLADVRDHSIELYKTPQSIGNSNYRAAIGRLETEIGKAGDGKSPVNPKKALFIVTDGIHDSQFKESNSVVGLTDHNIGPMDPAFCGQIKANGVILGVLYIDYITPAGYESAIDPFKSDVLPSLKACASDGMFFNATTPDGIAAAMKDMLAAAFGSGQIRLTN